MKIIKTFEEWSPKFNRTLQGAYNQAQVTNKGFGKAAKAVMDYAKRNITKEEFTATYVGYNNDIREFKFSFDPITLLRPTSEIKLELAPGKEYLKIPIIIKDLRKQQVGYSIDYVGVETKAVLYITNPEPTKLKVFFTDINVGNGPNDVPKTWKDEHLVIRLKDRTNIENFISMLIQAILSDPNKVNSRNWNIDSIYKWIESNEMDPKESAERKEQYPNLNVGEEYFNNLPGDTIDKKLMLIILNKLVIGKDMRNFI